MAGEPVKTGGLAGRPGNGLFQHGTGLAAARGLGDSPGRPNETSVGEAQNVVASPNWAIALSVGQVLQVIGSPEEPRDLPAPGSCLRRPGRHTPGLVIPRARSNRWICLLDGSGIDAAQRRIPCCPSPRRGANAREDRSKGVCRATAWGDVKWGTSGPTRVAWWRLAPVGGACGLGLLESPAQGLVERRRSTAGGRLAGGRAVRLLARALRSPGGDLACGRHERSLADGATRAGGWAGPGLPWRLHE
jgi:hypothetical protein